MRREWSIQHVLKILHLTTVPAQINLNKPTTVQAHTLWVNLNQASALNKASESFEANPIVDIKIQSCSLTAEITKLTAARSQCVCACYKERIKYVMTTKAHSSMGMILSCWSSKVSVVHTFVKLIFNPSSLYTEFEKPEMASQVCLHQTRLTL